MIVKYDHCNGAFDYKPQLEKVARFIAENGPGNPLTGMLLGFGVMMGDKLLAKNKVLPGSK